MPTPQERKLAKAMVDAMKAISPKINFRGSDIVIRSSKKEAEIRKIMQQIVEREDRAL
jgi:hypothetical protein